MSASDRIPFLRAVLASPNDDLPRLVYADYLEENTKTDLDEATVQFIRLSCDSRGKKMMPKATYPWLKANWKRLVPGFVKRNDQVSARFDHAWRSHPKGRLIMTSFVVPYAARPGAGNNYYSTRLVFIRGFLETTLMWSQRAMEVAYPLLRNDQPLVKFPNWPTGMVPYPHIRTDPAIDLISRG